MTLKENSTLYSKPQPNLLNEKHIAIPKGQVSKCTVLYETN